MFCLSLKPALRYFYKHGLFSEMIKIAKILDDEQLGQELVAYWEEYEEQRTVESKWIKQMLTRFVAFS